MIFFSAFNLKENQVYQILKKDKSHKFINYLKALKMKNHLYNCQQIY